MITSVSVWRCKCGVRIKVISETDRKAIPPSSIVVACPDGQGIPAHRIGSVTNERDEAAKEGRP
jgi:hypothetical protein